MPEIREIITYTYPEGLSPEECIPENAIIVTTTYVVSDEELAIEAKNKRYQTILAEIDELSATIAGIELLPGPQGEQGIPGESGAVGPKAGDIGLQGEPGIQGIQGEPGVAPAPYTLSLIAPTAFIAWTNMPATLTEFLGLAIQRTKADLSMASESRVTVRNGVAPYANAKIKVQYSTDESAWIDLCSVTMPATANKTNIGNWIAIPSGAKADVFIRLVGIDGNGTADPTFGLITLQVK